MRENYWTLGVERHRAFNPLVFSRSGAPSAFCDIRKRLRRGQEDLATRNSIKGLVHQRLHVAVDVLAGKARQLAQVGLRQRFGQQDRSFPGGRAPFLGDPKQATGEPGAVDDDGLGLVNGDRVAAPRKSFPKNPPMLIVMLDGKCERRDTARFGLGAALFHSATDDRNIRTARINIRTALIHLLKMLRDIRAAGSEKSTAALTCASKASRTKPACAEVLTRQPTILRA
jgi:hypothetical protein